jgi:eukaryotic-like serine/threonine-protein kinase
MGDADTTKDVDDRDGRLAVLAKVKRGLGLPVTPPVFGRYTLLRELGSGGLGIVYAAHDPELDREVAIKFLRADGPHGEASRSPSRLLREAQAIARLSHPNVVAVHDVGTYGPADRPERVGAASHGVYLVMELVDGLDLRQWLCAGPHPWRKIVEIFAAAGRGLAAAHDLGLVHRDFKPGNVLLGRDGRPRVVDFGLARGPGVASETAIEGTPAYMSPEQATGGELDARTDVFAFCVALQYALRGTASRDASTRGDAPIPRAVRDVIAQGLAPDREHRTKSMHEVIRGLERALGRRRRVAIAGAGVVAAALVGVVVHGVVNEQRALAHCDEAERTAAASWTDEIASDVRERFVASGSPAAEDAFARVDGAVEARLRTWTELRVDACKSLVRDPARIDDIGPRIVCLDRALGRLAGVIELLSAADGDVVVRSVAAVDAIRPEPDCTIASARDSRPHDVDAELERAIAHAEGLAGLGRMAASIDAWQRALADHDGMDDAAKSRVLVGLAAAQTGGGDYDGADQTLHQAMRAAERADDELEGLRVLEVRARVALLQGRIDDAREYAELAEARVSRGTFAPRHAATIALSLAAVAFEAGDSDEAGRIAERVRTEAAELADGDLESKAERTLGVVAAATSRFDDALVHHRRAVELEIDTYGRYSPTVASELVNIADLELRLEQLDAAETTLAHLREAVAAGGVTGHPIAVLADLLEAQLRLVQGRAHEAALLAERGAIAAERAFGAEHRHTGMAHALLADALLEDDRYDDALVAARRAVAIFEHHPHYGGLTGALLGLGAVALELGRPLDALAAYDRAIAVEEAAPGGGMAIDLARAYGGRADALALVHR